MSHDSVRAMKSMHKANHPHLDFVIFPNGHGLDIVFLAELLGEGGRHEPPPDVGGSCEVPLAALPARGRHEFVELHCDEAGTNRDIG